MYLRLYEILSSTITKDSGHEAGEVAICSFSLRLHLEQEGTSTFKYIGDGAFCDSKLTSLDLSVTLVTHIGVRAFYNSQLEALTLPPSLDYIGDGAFLYAELKTLTLPPSLDYIGEDPFYFSKLTSLDLSASLVTHVGDCAFLWSTFTTVKLPDTSVHIGYNAFSEVSR